MLLPAEAGAGRRSLPLCLHLVICDILRSSAALQLSSETERNKFRGKVLDRPHLPTDLRDRTRAAPLHDYRLSSGTKVELRRTRLYVCIQLS
jgi:hypothetical protein